jgi:DNA replication and repair protein RecF
MRLTDIRLHQFRCYDSAHFQFDPSLTLITGKNGAGKTNLLEAVYVIAQGTSFRVSDGDLLQYDKEWWRLDATLDNNDRQVRYQVGRAPAKQLIIHDSAKRFTYKDRLPVVLFEPTDLQLIHGSPSRRRDALDTMLIALSLPYKQALSRYERALQQRNNILRKQPGNWEDMLFSWDVLLSEYGVVIASERRRLIEKLNDRLPALYSDVAGEYQELKLVYRSELPGDITGTNYIARLHHKLPLDRLRGTTSIGPHRDDLDFILRGEDAKQSASRGEVRTTLLALKVAYAGLLEELYGFAPLILLDDVFSELDADRQTNLLKLVRHNQTIITDTKEIPVLMGRIIKL